MIRTNNLKSVKSLLLLLVTIAIIIGRVTAKNPIQESKNLQQLKTEFIDLRFGMFICYNIMSYGAEWGEANYPIDSFNPEKLDCNQWAKAAKAAGMTFGLLTTKHHEGFCLWDSEYTEYDVAGTPYKKDIVKQYVDAFRTEGLKTGLYYSIWDSTHDITENTITRDKMEFIKGQITELLTNYGEINYFVMDGWFWKMGHKEVSYEEIRNHIRTLQPNCLITDHTHLQAPYHMEIPYFEGPFGAFPPKDNTMASALGHCSLQGNGWFWNEETPTGMKKNDGLDTIISKLNDCEDRYCNFMLNCMPNRDGLLDEIYIDLLNEIGQNWQPDQNRLPLPKQPKQVYESIPIINATASSGIAENVFSPTKIPGGSYYFWETDSVLPQNIILDLGQVHSGINTMLIVGNHRCKPGPETALWRGNITKCKVLASVDNQQYTLLGNYEFNSDSKYRSITFKNTDLRYLKVEVTESNGESVIVSQIEIGRSEIE